MPFGSARAVVVRAEFVRAAPSAAGKLLRGGSTAAPVPFSGKLPSSAASAKMTPWEWEQKEKMGLEDERSARIAKLDAQRQQEAAEAQRRQEEWKAADEARTARACAKISRWVGCTPGRAG